MVRRQDVMRTEQVGQMESGQSVDLHWLSDLGLSVPTGVTWGVPWNRGELHKDSELLMQDGNGKNVPLQSWQTAYWPDGSVKWTAHAASISAAASTYKLMTKGEAQVDSTKGEVTTLNGASSENDHTSGSTLQVTEDDSVIEVNTGVIICRFGKSGSSLVREIIRDGHPLCTDGRLIGIYEQHGHLSGMRTSAEMDMESVIEQTVVEQSGPLRAVIRISGRHQLQQNGRRWLPFTVRFTLYANQTGIKVTHTFLYDGNPHQDFIKGLGIRFSVPMQGELYNRHVRIAGDTGWFSESPKGLMLFRLAERQRELYERQTAGESIELDPEVDAVLAMLLADSAVWSDIKLVQQSCDSYTISKRTQSGCSWIRAAMGNRARGLLYAGSEIGGLAVGLRHFWEKYPSALEASGLSDDSSAITAWFWSPEGTAMDLRHYDTKTHVRSSYEGADELRSTPYGVGNTHELMVWCCDATPDATALDAMVQAKEEPPLLVCKPQRYYETKAFGSWSLPDRSTPMKAQLEDMLDQLILFYQEEVEQRRWYGFWDYGDFMHSYDPVRHTWKYDIGGCAWQNTELAPNIWLWYSFLRTGRADVFRLAEAMTRHTSEVDLYHIGEYAGLGSRHNVLHWGCGCKEARIGMAGLHRYYYYLTADERIGDILDEVKDADYATLRVDPMRAYFAKDEFPTHTRSGPDWSAFCSNWIAQWERYEDESYRDKMLTGIECLKQMPDRLLTGPVFGYDPKTGKLMYMSDENYGHHLMICMGGAQVWTEMVDLIGDPEWERMLIEYGEFYNLPNDEKERRTNGRIKGKDWNIPMLSTTMMAYAASRTGNEQLARQAWEYLLHSNFNWSVRSSLAPQSVPRDAYIREIREHPWISTNTVSQWSINLIICLEWIAEYLPDTINTEGGETD